MFGYLQIEKSELKIKGFEKYRAIYCSLCKQIGKDYSFLSRLILSYDCTFFAIVLLSLKNECPGFCTGRCRFNPIKKCSYCAGGEEAFKAAAALSVVSAYYKLLDDIYDSGFLKKALLKMVIPVFENWRGKAIKNYPKFDKIFEKMLIEQQKVEVDDNVCIDKACEPTANMLSQVLKLYAHSDTQKRIFEQMGYFLGRWIYMCDAVNDLNDDTRKRRFNPLKKQAGETVYFEQMLNQAAYQAYMAYNLYEPKHFKDLLDNVFVYGLESMKDKVLKHYKTENMKKAGDDIG